MAMLAFFQRESAEHEGLGNLKKILRLIGLFFLPFFYFWKRKRTQREREVPFMEKVFLSLFPFFQFKEDGNNETLQLCIIEIETLSCDAFSFSFFPPSFLLKPSRMVCSSKDPCDNYSRNA